MEAYHVGKFRTLLSSHVPVSCTVRRGDVLIATAGYSNKSTASLWHLHGCQRPIELSGHDSPITSVTLSSHDLSSKLMLCTSSQHTIILWDVEQVLRAHNNGRDPNRLVIPLQESTVPVRYTCFSANSHYVLVCAGPEGLLYRVKDGKLDTTVSGHAGLITCAAFSPCQQDILVTAAEDRTFMVWDIANSVLMYQSSIISAHPFLSISMDPYSGHVMLGSANGKLRVYDLSNIHRCLHEVDLGMKLSRLRAEKQFDIDMQKYNEASVTIGTSRLKQPGRTLEEAQQSLAVEQGVSILSLYCHRAPAAVSISDVDEGLVFISPTTSQLKLQKVLNSSSQIWVSLHHSLMVLNADTLDVVAYWDLQDPILCIDDVEHTHCSMPISYSSSFCWDEVNSEMICANGAFAQGVVSVLNIKQVSEFLSKATMQEASDESNTSKLSVTACVPLCADSPLRAELVSKATIPAKKAASGGQAAARGRVVQDRPLTFHSRVNSSGYTAQPRGKMFVPVTSYKPKATTQKSSGTLSSKMAYPSDGGIPLALYHTITVSAPINQIDFSGDGQKLACGTVDKLAHILTMPPSSSRSKTFSGHSSSVTSVKWSEDNRWLLTCSTDKVARVWTDGRKDPVLAINTVKHNFTSEQKDMTNMPFNKEVTHAQFCYMDKFILLASGNTLYLYKYNIDLSKVDEVRRYMTNNKYRLVKDFPVDNVQSITAMSSINSFFSYIVLLGCSNKSVLVYDMNVGKCVHTFTDVHTRHPHTIEQNKGSKYTTLPAGAHDLFLTSAVSDGIKLWDLRTIRCVKRYEAHTGCFHPLGVRFSPCGQYIASGSENKCAYLYDMKSNNIHKLTGHSQVVSDVAFHPVRPLLASASLSGDIKFFKP